MDKHDLKWMAVGMTPIWCFLGLFALIWLTGCAHNPCIDNPRNMQCMTADEIEEALDV